MFINRGFAHKYGNNINTDYIIPSHRKRDITDPKELSKYVLEDIDAKFAARVSPGDILVGGSNFGCGSAMEVAVTVLKSLEIRAVLAQSFARSFYRNAINNGLLVIECDTDRISMNDDVEITVDHNGFVRVFNHSTDAKITSKNIPLYLSKIIQDGGILLFLKKNGKFEFDTASTL